METAFLPYWRYIVKEGERKHFVWQSKSGLDKIQKNALHEELVAEEIVVLRESTSL